MKYLYSSSFKKHTDLMQQAYLNDMEADKESINLGMRFFEDVENVKEDMSQVERHYRKLQDAINEQSKIVPNGKELRAQMVSDVEQVLKHVKVIKGRLEGLENSNAAHRKLPGCGQGSPADRTRTSIINGLGKKLKNMMDNFQGLRNRMTLEYRETVERRYFTITGEEATQENIGNMMSTGESESFLQKLNQEQGKGQIMIDGISEIQERHDALKDIEKNLMELHLVFLDMAALVESQGHQLNDIQSHVAQSNLFVRRGSTDDLQDDMGYEKISPTGTCIAIAVAALVLAILLLPFLTKYVFLHQWS